jgi:L-proline amide hydrolase
MLRGTWGQGSGSVRMGQFHHSREGFATFRGYKTHFRVSDNGGTQPALLCVHGGPGFGSDYLRPLAAMGQTGRPVVLYDQLGCGASDHPGAGIDWSLSLFVEELEAVRAAAQLEQCHVLGHGWGGVIALEYALRQPEGLAGLVLASTVPSIPRWREELAGLVAQLPEDVRLSLEGYRCADTGASNSCPRLLAIVLRRHLCRLSPWPELLERAVIESRAHPAAGRVLFGNSLLAPAGRLAGWDVTPRLGEIRCPTLVTCGRHDIATPVMAAALYQGIPASEWVVLEHSAHVPHLEEPQRYLELLDGFLGKYGGGPRKRRA